MTLLFTSDVYQPDCTAIVGGQFGSEGKGLLVAHVASQYGVHVRVGAANAGHTFYTTGVKLREKHVTQQIPCAAYANPEAICVLGPGAMLNRAVLAEEVQANGRWRYARGLPPLVLFIDQNAHVVAQQHIEEEASSDLAKRIGSTSTIAREGIGAAQAAKVLRRADCVQAKSLDWPGPPHTRIQVGDSTELLMDLYGVERILLEGTQGTGLSLNHGYFPYTTSRETTAAGLAADCGLGPRHVDDVLMVCRTYPIRVAGNSGPFAPGSKEIRFADIGQKEEKTTVTKLVRRVATFSMEQVRRAAFLNSATQIALTFADYLAPSLYEKTGMDYTAPDQRAVTRLVREIELETLAPVTYLGTGPASVVERWREGLEAQPVGVDTDVDI